MDIKEFFIGSLKENRKLIISLYVIFIIVFIASWILNAPVMESIAGNLTASSNPVADTSALELFIHNEWGGIVTYFASIFFGIFAVIMVIVNGYSMGTIGPLFAKIVPNGGIFFIIYLIPHGIFEITGMVLQSAAGILLFLFVWRFIKAWRSRDTDRAYDAFEMTKKSLIQSIALMVIASILILIAAPIEAYVSVPLSEALMELLGLI